MKGTIVFPEYPWCRDIEGHRDTYPLSFKIEDRLHGPYCGPCFSEWIVKAIEGGCKVHEAAK